MEEKQIQIMNRPTVYSPRSSISQHLSPLPSPLISNNFLSSNNIIPPSLENGGELKPAGYSVELDAQGNKHIVQHIIYQAKKKKKDKEKDHEKERKKDKKKEKNKDKSSEKDEDDDNKDKRVNSLLEHYIGRQNELMERLLKDFDQDKKLESQKNRELLEKISMNLDSLPRQSSQKNSRISLNSPFQYSPSINNRNSE